MAFPCNKRLFCRFFFVLPSNFIFHRFSMFYHSAIIYKFSFNLYQKSYFFSVPFSFYILLNPLEISEAFINRGSSVWLSVSENIILIYIKIMGVLKEPSFWIDLIITNTKYSPVFNVLNMCWIRSHKVGLSNLNKFIFSKYEDNIINLVNKKS